MIYPGEGASIYEPRRIHEFVTKQLRLLMQMMMKWSDGIVDRKDMRNILQMLADEVVQKPDPSELPWNWCSECDNPVDADDIFDGTEVKCASCGQRYVCVAFKHELVGVHNYTWQLDKVEDEEVEDEGSDLQ